MRNPPARLTITCGLLALLLTLAAGLNGAERGLGTLVGAGAAPSVAYFSRCGPGIYDLAVLGQHRRLSLVIPVADVSASGRIIRLSRGRVSIAVNLAPSLLRPGEIGRTLSSLRERFSRFFGGAGQVIRALMRRVKS
ncbi:MAG: hypothetical protein ACM3XN_06060 [Chloroflexota bacterium]